MKRNVPSAIEEYEQVVGPTTGRTYAIGDTVITTAGRLTIESIRLSKKGVILMAESGKHWYFNKIDVMVGHKLYEHQSGIDARGGNS